MPFFSVIVPVYNTEQYLAECVAGVLGQSCGDFELLLVDDGSTDASGALCDDFARRDARVRALHQQNAGPSVARNAGMDAARGEYLLFLDSDDLWLGTDFLERLRGTIGQSAPDLALFGYRRYLQGGDGWRAGAPEIHFPAALPESTDEAFTALADVNAYQSSAWSKAVRRRGPVGALRFPPGVHAEDVQWCAEALLAAGSVAWLDAAPLGYRVRPGSATQSISPKYAEDLAAVLERLAAKGPAGGVPPGRAAAYWGYLAFQYCTLLINSTLASPPPGPEALRRVRALASLLRGARDRQAKLVRGVYRAAGFGATRRLLTAYFRLFRH